MQKTREELKQAVKTAFLPYKTMVKRPASGYIPYDYLVPSGYYQEQWDWDAFFIGTALASELPSEAIYLKNWTRNYVHFADNNGKVPGCVTPAGADSRLNHMKPIIGQGTYLACQKLKDFDWVKPIWEKIKLIVSYREKNQWNAEYDLGVWYNCLESGADNDIAYVDMEPMSVLSPDINAFLYREFQAMAKLAAAIGEEADKAVYEAKAKRIYDNVNKYLWDEEHSIYVSIDLKTKKTIRHVTYSAFLPLWVKLAPPEKGKASIQKYFLSRDHLWTDFGLRTLSKQDAVYNNANIIKPYSNWQGPIWPIVNWLFMQSMLNYGFQKEAIEQAENLTTLVLADIEKTGGMHEDYHADTGEPLAAPNFVSWNLLVGNMIDEAENNYNPLAFDDE